MTESFSQVAGEMIKSLKPPTSCTCTIKINHSYREMQNRPTDPEWGHWSLFFHFFLVSASTSSAPYRMRSSVIIACQGKPWKTQGFTVENGPLEKEIPYFWKITHLFRFNF